jgi:ATP-dependent Clp protease ATP-binding subunit ClpX
MKASQRELFNIRWTPREIYAELDKYVIGQERAKRVISIAAYNHLKRVELRARGEDIVPKKSNILLIGPTGCGKTHIARNLARILNVPFTVVDATEYTEAGYYGKDVEVMIGELLFKTDLDVEATQKGIIFIDEIDKIARRGHGARTGAGSRDIGGEGVQQGLLKLLEGQEIFVPLNVTQHWNKHDFTLVDTTDILFICAGTFSDLQRGTGSTEIGFTGQGANRLPRIGVKALLEYGLLA